MLMDSLNTTPAGRDAFYRLQHGETLTRTELVRAWDYYRIACGGKLTWAEFSAGIPTK